MKFDRAVPDLVRLFSDERLPIETRLRVAIALANLEDRRGGNLMRKIAFEQSEQSDFAIKNLPKVIGDEAAPVLCELVNRFGKSSSYPAWQAMHHVSGKAAVPPPGGSTPSGKAGVLGFRRGVPRKQGA
jgi:hypothetical protein